jgi:hypothetical protein
LDNGTLRTQLVALERRVVSGHETVSHPQVASAHDDVATAVCGALVTAAARVAQEIPITSPGYYVAGVEISAPRSFSLSPAAVEQQPELPRPENMVPTGDAELARLGSREPPRRRTNERAWQDYINASSGVNRVPGGVLGQPLPSWWGK